MQNLQIDNQQKGCVFPVAFAPGSFEEVLVQDQPLYKVSALSRALPALVVVVVQCHPLSNVCFSATHVVVLVGCRMSGVCVPKFKHGIISKRFELEG